MIASYPFEFVAIATWRNKRGKGPMPWPIGLYEQCRQFNALPRTGGILDQNNYEMSMMDHALAVQYMAEFTSEIKASKALMPGQLELWKHLKATQG